MARLRQPFALLVFLVICLAAGGFGTIFTTSGPYSTSSAWYTANRPSWTPPSAVFGPVWTTLYTLMAIAAWLVWRKRGFRDATAPFAFFTMQLILNAAWTPVFFGLGQAGMGFAIIVLLALLILATLIAFWRVTPWAGILLLPYLAWVTYAATINYGFWRNLATARH